MISTSIDQPSFLTLENDIEIAFTDEGKGEQTLLFVHGLSSNSLIWRQNIGVFKNHYRCVALDLPGHGRGRLHPDLFTKLILVAPAGFEQFTSTERKLMTGHYLQQVMQSPFYKRMIDALQEAKNLPLAYGAPDLTAKYGFFQGEIPSLKSEQYLSLCIEAMLKHSAHDLLHRILQPTLVLFGDDDRLIPNRMFHRQSTKEVAIEGASHIHNCQLIMLPDCGHYVQFEKPKEFNAAVYRFLNPAG
ncbi:MAG: alpha/beta hydrolase [Chitinophagaceae bacterium]|nr:MAG: alpha/beta hydrolase [Chitinophagaceae bacterium]